MTDFDGKTVLIESGTSIQLPVYAIHHGTLVQKVDFLSKTSNDMFFTTFLYLDERFYDAPNSFRPERFDLQSVNELKKRGQFLPFGDGPRQCLGKFNPMLI